MTVVIDGAVTAEEATADGVVLYVDVAASDPTWNIALKVCETELT